MKKYFTTMIFFILSGSCSQSDIVADYGVIQMDPSSSPTSGICATTFELTEIYGQQVTLIELSALVKDQNGMQAVFHYVDQPLLTVVSSTILPARGQLNGTLALDLGSNGLTAPATGSLVIVGTNPSGTSQFVGEIDCATF